jgi:hypothetical protein
LFAGIVVPLVLLYMTCHFAGGDPPNAAGNLRYLIPTFPFFAIGGVWLLGCMAERLGGSGRAAVTVVAALQLVVSVGASTRVLATAKASLGAAARARALANKEIPAGSVVIVDRALAESLDATGQWRLAEENVVAGPPGTAAVGERVVDDAPGGIAGANNGDGYRSPTGGRDRPNPQQHGSNRAQHERYAGLRPAERRTLAWSDVAAWSGGQPVYWFVRSLEAVDAALPHGASYHTVGEVEVPTLLDADADNARQGRVQAKSGRGRAGIDAVAGGSNAGRESAGVPARWWRGRNFSVMTPRLRVVRIEFTTKS